MSLNCMELIARLNTVIQLICITNPYIEWCVVLIALTLLRAYRSVGFIIKTNLRILILIFQKLIYLNHFISYIL